MSDQQNWTPAEMAYAACDAIRDAHRNGTVASQGYTDNGWPIGGHLTADACGVIAGARWDMVDMGMPWHETEALFPGR